MDSSIGIIFRGNNEILLVKRRDIPVWVIPGGLIEKETPEEAVIREVREETGFRTRILRKVAVYKYRPDKRDHLFLCAIVSGKPTIGSESKEIRFFNINDLPEEKHPFIPKWIKDTLENRKEVLEEKISDISLLFALKNFFKHPVIVTRYFLTKVGLRINT